MVNTTTGECPPGIIGFFNKEYFVVLNDKHPYGNPVQAIVDVVEARVYIHSNLPVVHSIMIKIPNPSRVLVAMLFNCIEQKTWFDKPPLGLFPASIHDSHFAINNSVEHNHM